MSGRRHSGHFLLKGLWALYLKYTVSLAMWTYLPYSCARWGTTKATAIACNVLAIAWAALFSSSDGFSCLVFRHSHTKNYKQLRNANTMEKN